MYQEFLEVRYFFVFEYWIRLFWPLKLSLILKAFQSIFLEMHAKKFVSSVVCFLFLFLL